MAQYKSFYLGLIAGLVAALAGVPSTHAQKTNQVPQAEAVQAAIGAILNSPERLPFHLQRVRKSLSAHYVKNNAPSYWVHNLSHVAQFIQRMILADDDGLKPGALSPRK